MTKLWASIADPSITDNLRSQIHYRGTSPGIAAELGLPQGTPMPPALIVVIDSGEPTSGYFLNRFSHDGLDAGDTWHVSVDDAKAQAMLEFGGLLTAWQAIPDEVSTDEFVRKQLRRHR
jgi:hypothetical protein